MASLTELKLKTYFSWEVISVFSFYIFMAVKYGRTIKAP